LAWFVFIGLGTFAFVLTFLTNIATRVIEENETNRELEISFFSCFIESFVQKHQTNEES